MHWTDTLSNSTKTLLGLSTSATPDQAFQKLQSLVQTAQSTADSRTWIETGNYTGANWERSNSISFSGTPIVVFISGGENGNVYYDYSGIIIPAYSIPATFSRFFHRQDGYGMDLSEQPFTWSASRKTLTLTVDTQHKYNMFNRIDGVYSYVAICI